MALALTDYAGKELHGVILYDANGAPLLTALAEDTAHQTGDKGFMPLAVRKDTAAALAGTDADYIPFITDANGRLHVDLSAIGKDSTDKLAVSLYYKKSVAGDQPVIGHDVYGLRVSPYAGGATPTDGVSNTNLPVSTNQAGNDVYYRTIPQLLNPSNTWDRIRSIAASGAGLGVQQVGTLGELITLAASAERTVDGTATAITGLGWRNRYIVLVDVTALGSVAGDTLDIYIDVSLDGTTWLNAIHGTQRLGNGAAAKEFAILDPSNPGTSTINVTSDAAAGAVRPALFGPQMRARWVIVNGGGTHAFTFAVLTFTI